MVKGSDGAEELLVAEVLSDDVLLIDAASGEMRRRFDLSTSAVVPSAYPIAVVATRDGDVLRISGPKSFCTGANGSDMLLVGAVEPGVPGTLARPAAVPPYNGD